MSSGVLERLTNKKAHELSTILNIDFKNLKTTKLTKESKSYSLHSSSEPDTRVIANIKETIKNPIFNLTIADYELMCGNFMITKMMSKVLECDEKQLKKFCKYINVFAKNIESSPKSIRKIMKNRMTLNKLPYDLKIQIVNKYKTIFNLKYVLKDWIPLNKLDWKFLSTNPNAIDLLKKYPKNINWKYLSSNTNAIELLKANPEKINWSILSFNSNAIELIKKKIIEEKNMSESNLYNLDDNKKINWDILSANPSAIDLLKANPEKINWNMLSTNQNAIELLKENPNEIDWKHLSENPNAIELLKTRFLEETIMDKNVLYRLDSSKKLNYKFLSKNLNAIELLKENPKKIFWPALSANPNAIELLKENPKNIDWESLSKNPNAIELLQANPNNINWDLVSGNPSAIELLKANPTKINWNNLSTNPSIFNEILE